MADAQPKRVQALPIVSTSGSRGVMVLTDSSYLPQSYAGPYHSLEPAVVCSCLESQPQPLGFRPLIACPPSHLHCAALPIPTHLA